MVLVTGSTGLLGSHVVCDLLVRSIPVRALFRSEKRQKRVLHLLNYYYPENAETLYAQIDWCEGDVLDLVSLEDAMNGCEKVIHCAAMVSFHRRDFSALFEHNRGGTANVVNVALHLGLKQLLHVSSTAAIGSDSPEHDTVRRETNKWNPNEKASGYALSKYSAEKEVWRGIEEGLHAAIVNPSVLFGPGNWNESSLQIMRTLSGGLRFYTPGGDAFVDVRDVSEIILRLLENDISGERFLVTGHNSSFRELFERICRQLDVRTPSVAAGSFMTSFAWRIAGMLGRITGKRPTLTRESAASAHRTTRYSSEKVLKQFPDFQFRSLDEMIGNTINGRLHEHVFRSKQ